MRKRTAIPIALAAIVAPVAVGVAHSHHPRMGGVAMRATRVLRALLGGFALLAVLAIPASARADAVTDWNQVAAAALQSPGTATPPGAGQGAASTAHLAMVHAAAGSDLDGALDEGWRLFEPVYLSEDAQEGPRAFLEKRPPVWKGR